MTREEQLLIDRMVDGTLPPANLPALENCLSSDPEALAHYCSQSRIHGSLEWYFSALGTQSRALKRNAQLVEKRRTRQQKRILLASFAIAAVLVLFTGLTFFMIRAQKQPTMALRFNSQTDFKIIHGDAETGRATRKLQVNDELLLTRGAVELTLGSGIRAVVEAPASLSLVGTKHIRMDEGKGHFEITKDSGRGFKVSLPQSEIIDLGTRFGVVAEKGKPAQIHLLEGQIRTRRLSGGSQKFSGHPILSGRQALREDDTSRSGYSIMSADEDAFSRTLPGNPGHVHLSFDRFAKDGSPQATGLRDTGRVELVPANGGKLETVPGKIGRAMRFDGSGSFIRVTGWQGIGGDEPRTVCFWAKFPKLDPLPPNRGMGLVTWGEIQNPINRRWELNLNSGDQGLVGVIRTTTGSNEFALGATTLYDGKWHHIASVYDPEAEDGLKLKTFIDGNPEHNDESKLGEIDTRQTSFFQIGKNLAPEYSGSFPLEGLLDELHIFHRALSKNEIISLSENPLTE